MEFKELQKHIMERARRYEKENGVKVDADFAALKLVEEVGELYQALIIYLKKSRPEKYVSAKKAKKDMSHEMADVAGMLVVLANELDVDLEKALKEKWKWEEKTD